MWFSFVPSSGDRRVIFIVERPDLRISGDIESAFFDQMTAFRRLDGETFGRALAEALGDNHEAETAAVVRNPNVVFDARLTERIERTVAALAALGGKWTIAAAGGLGLLGTRYCSMYSSEEPFLPMGSSVQPVIDIFPDLYLINLHTLGSDVETIAALDVGFEVGIIIAGYLRGCVSVYAPTLSTGINGHFLRRDFARLVDEIQGSLGSRLPGARVETLAGTISISERVLGGAIDHGQTVSRPNPLSSLGWEKAVKKAIEPHYRVFSLSIVTRTRFQRMHLLRRMLASITRAHSGETCIEIILATDADKTTWKPALAQLASDFPSLKILVEVNNFKTHSRVGNLLAGLAAATCDYVLFLDDDDYIDTFAFTHLKQAFFLTATPVIFVDVEVHAEKWIETSSGRHVLASSERQEVYGHLSWRKAFAGVNLTPICGFLIQRKDLLYRLANLPLNYDLSEDYAIVLAILTDPTLPEIFELPATICHVSVRGSENTITMDDRRGWTHDIAGYLYDLVSSNIASCGAWDVLTRLQRGSEGRAKDLRIRDLEAQLSNQARLIQQLRIQLSGAMNSPPHQPVSYDGKISSRQAPTDPSEISGTKRRRRIREIS